MNRSTPEDKIHVVLHDLVFFVGLLDSQGEGELEKLSIELLPLGPSGGQTEGISCQLHCESRGSLGKRFSFDILDDGASDAPWIYAAMLVKVLIFTGKKSPAKVRRHLCEINDVTMSSMQTPEFLHVPVVNNRALWHFSYLAHVVSQRS